GALREDEPEQLVDQLHVRAFEEALLDLPAAAVAGCAEVRAARLVGGAEEVVAERVEPGRIGEGCELDAPELRLRGLVGQLREHPALGRPTHLARIPPALPPPHHAPPLL